MESDLIICFLFQVLKQALLANYIQTKAFILSASLKN